MEMGKLSCLLILLISLVSVNARYKEEPVLMDEGEHDYIKILISFSCYLLIHLTARF